MINYKLILTSGSPRRIELLQKVFPDIEIIVPNIDEHIEALSPKDYVLAIAEKKAMSVINYVAEYYGPYLRDAKKESFNVIFLDIKNKPIHNIEISKGSINASVVDPKEIIKEATLKSASSIILVHNHPSGDTEPSSEDINLTNRIIDACNLVGIKVLDHIIIGKNKEDYYSLASAGLIK